MARRLFYSGTDALSFRFSFVSSTSIGSSPTFSTPPATPIGFNLTPVPQSPRAALKLGEVSDPPFASTIKNAGYFPPLAVDLAAGACSANTAPSAAPVEVTPRRASTPRNFSNARSTPFRAASSLIKN
ncbi:MAG: hypothetical protein NTX09_02935 [Verrucomicrobia bacterium]|nr:hypothetical protein [Verrucomicrobiota bacterium]